MEASNKTRSYCINSTDRLFDSIRGGEDEVTVQDLLQECADIDARDAEGYTPLLLACLMDREKLVDLLINCGANVDAKCYSDEHTVLHYASKNGSINIVRTLVEKVHDLDARDIRGETAMHHASRSGNLEVVQCLVDEGAGINIKSSVNRTPLLCAAEYSRIDVVNLLLDSGANVDGYEGMLLSYASKYGWTDLVRSFVKRVPDLNERLIHGRPALHLASLLGYSAIVQCLLKEGADINAKDSTGLTALHNGCRHLEIVKLLVEGGIDIYSSSNKVGATALHAATASGQLEIVKFLVEKGADINMKDFKNEAPVLKAARHSHKDVANLLIQCGADVDIPGEKKQTLLHYASKHGWIDTVQAIVKRNCDLDARDIHGATALGIACLRPSRDIVQYLLQAGASWDILDKKGCSPLNYIARRKDPDINCIKLLIENGAYLMHVDYEGIVTSSSLKVLQDVKLCCRAIVNKFNNHDLPQLYKLPASGNLPRIEEMKIARGSEVARAIERAVEFEIKTKGHCNVLEVHPMVLRVFSVRSVLEYCEKRKSEEFGSRLKQCKVEDI